MRLVCPVLNDPLIWEDGGIQTLVMENHPFLRSFLSGLARQLEGEEEGFVFSVNYDILDLSRFGELITDPLSLPTENRKLIGRLTQSILSSADGRHEEVVALICAINALAHKIASEQEFNIVPAELDNPEALIKLMGFHLDKEGAALPEQLLDYLTLSRGLLGKKLFIVYGLHALLSEEEMEQFCKEAAYRKLSLLLIEGFQPTLSAQEKMTIIDKDLCIF